MEIKKIESKKVFYHSLKSTLQTLTNDVGNIPNQLVVALNKAGLKEQGPQEWVYYGSDGKPNTEFALEICLPIEGVANSMEKVKWLEEGTFAIEIHKGAWAALGGTYQKMIQEIMKTGKQATGISREIYHVCDFVNQDNCITEVQIEVI